MEPESLDLRRLLQDWPYEPGQINVRVIRGDDGEPKIQVRLDLGVLQMNAHGRPDGERPHGFPSLLEYLEQLDDNSDADPLEASDEEGAHAHAPEPQNDTRNPSGVDTPNPTDGRNPGDLENEAVSLGPDECRSLRDEAAQFYHRYVALLVLEDFEGVIRDTTRNLRVLDLCRTHAETDEDKAALEPVRPYITMVRARAMASQALKENETKAAVWAIDQGLDQLRAHFIAIEAMDHFEQSGEVQMLRAMREALVPKLPVSQRAELRQRLQEALARENYELAAILRDELRLIQDPPPGRA